MGPSAGDAPQRDERGGGASSGSGASLSGSWRDEWGNRAVGGNLAAGAPQRGQRYGGAHRQGVPSAVWEAEELEWGEPPPPPPPPQLPRQLHFQPAAGQLDPDLDLGQEPVRRPAVVLPVAPMRAVLAAAAAEAAQQRLGNALPLGQLPLHVDCTNWRLHAATLFPSLYNPDWHCSLFELLFELWPDVGRAHGRGERALPAAAFSFAARCDASGDFAVRAALALSVVDCLEDQVGSARGPGPGCAWDDQVGCVRDDQVATGRGQGAAGCLEEQVGTARGRGRRRGGGEALQQCTLCTCVHWAV